jgi:CheY-like chemotaxis protein
LVEVVPDGLKVLEALKRAQFDLVLMDIQMPELDGLKTTAAIRANEASNGTRIPIIALTAHAMSGDRERCLAAGMDGYLSKPLRAQELIDTIESLIPDLPSSAPSDDNRVESKNNGASFDRAALLNIVEGDLTLLRELISVFLVDTPGLLTQLREAVGRRDGPRIGAVSHRLRGSVANFQAHTAALAAQQLEETAGRGNLAEVDRMFTDFERATTELMDGLRAFKA